MRLGTAGMTAASLGVQVLGMRAYEHGLRFSYGACLDTIVCSEKGA